MCLSFLFLSLELAFIFVLIDACYRFPLPFPSPLRYAAPLKMPVSDPFAAWHWHPACVIHT
jgi:hypothetical protein